MQKIFYTLLYFALLAGNVYAQDCSNGRYIEPVFDRIKVTQNIVYARKPQSNGQMIDLKYDVYEPYGDTLSARPVMLLMHGGAYLKLIDESSPDLVRLCKYFAKRGYVALSIDYRQEPNVNSLKSEEKMVKAVSRALIDTKEAVDHFVNMYINGNPFRIDTSKAIIGGVSAGAVSSMFICFIDSIGQFSQQYQQWIIEANGTSADSILRHKFDLIKPKIAISISGALLDTNWIKPNGIDYLLVHGSEDEIVPYNYGHPLNLTNLPLLYGGKAQYPVMLRQGIYVEFEDWIGRGHVPFMNLTFPQVITDFFNEPILDSTERHIAQFCYRLMDCATTTTGIHNSVIKNVDIYPNPSSNNFTIQLPQAAGARDWMVEIYDIMGKQVFQQNYLQAYNKIDIVHQLPPNTYILKLLNTHNDQLNLYNAKIIVAK